MSPIEAMATSMLHADLALFGYEPRALETVNGVQREMYERHARAALIALRDNGVTEGMSEAASHVDGVYVGDQEFRAMLDAALEGE